MSSASDYEHSEASQEASDEASRPPTRPVSRASRPESRASTPRKRRRLESVDPSQVRRHYLKGKYNDAYRVLYNDDVSRAATRFEASSEEYKHRTTQIGASVWSAAEQATFFAALERLGRDDLPGIAGAIGTKSIPETQELLLLLHDAAVKQGDAKVTLRDIPAATEVGSACAERLDVAGEALAWYQETFEANQEKERYGDYWLITPAIAETIEDAFNPSRPRATTSPIASEPEARRRGGRVIAGYVGNAQVLEEC
jgi:RNA polymerase I-specific transcription initiation factor RRN5